MKKTIITIDLNKINKEKINTRTYTNKEGEEVIVKDYKMEVVPLKKKILIKTGNDWKLDKTHFVCDAQTKEERKEKKETNFLGEGMQFSQLEDMDLENIDLEENKKEEEPVIQEDAEEIDVEENLPF